MNDLNCIRNIRNKFAHRIDPGFKTDQIRDFCCNLKYPHKLCDLPRDLARVSPRDAFILSVGMAAFELSMNLKDSEKQRRQIADDMQFHPADDKTPIPQEEKK